MYMPLPPITQTDMHAHAIYMYTHIHTVKKDVTFKSKPGWKVAESKVAAIATNW